jgi:tetratricopeptide (TPR) repeat protein
VKRAILATALLLGTLALAYGYGVTRREANYRELLRTGEAAAGAGDWVAAIEAFSGAIALKPGAMAAYLKRGEAYSRRSELDSAMRDLRRATELDPLAPRPRELLGDVSYAMGRYTRAAERYREYIALDDSSHRLFYKLGLSQYRAGQPSACVTALESALELRRDSAEAHYLMGLCLRDARKPKEAIASLERSVALAPATLHAREELADVYGRLGRSDDRIAQLEALLALDPGPSREVTLGSAHAAAGDTTSAIQVLSRAARRYPTYRYTYVALGRVWLDIAQASGDPVAVGKALEALQNATGAEDNGEALALAGRALLLGGDPAAAERSLQQATEKLPVEPVTYFHLADAAERVGHLDVAREALLDYDALVGASSVRRRGVLICMRIAELSMRLDDAATAVAWYERAASAAPADAGVLVALADAEHRTGNAKAAKATLQKALAIDPAHPAALALKRKLW